MSLTNQLEQMLTGASPSELMELMNGGGDESTSESEVMEEVVVERKRAAKVRFPIASASSLKRIGYVAGVSRMDATVQPALRKLVTSELEKILKDAVTYMEHARRTTLQLGDLLAAFERRNIRVYGGEDVELKLCKKYPTKKTDLESKQHRFKSGTRALMKIRFYQKQSDCFYLSFAPFQEEVRRVISDYKNDVRVSKEVFSALQVHIEAVLIRTLQVANKLQLHANRQTLDERDINLTLELAKMFKRGLQ